MPSKYSTLLERKACANGCYFQNHCIPLCIWSYNIQEACILTKAASSLWLSLNSCFAFSSWWLSLNSCFVSVPKQISIKCMLIKSWNHAINFHQSRTTHNMKINWKNHRKVTPKNLPVVARGTNSKIGWKNRGSREGLGELREFLPLSINLK